MASPIGSDRRALALVLAAVLGVPGPALAQQQGGTLAQSLFDRARGLMDEGKFAEACPLLVESQRLDPGGGTLLNIAVCWEGAGRLATANEAFHAALGQAIKDERAERKKLAEERIAALAPRLSTLVIDVPAAARVPDLSVFVDGTRLPTVAWGVPAAVDGGPHRIDASAPGRTAFTIQVEVKVERDQVRVTVPELPVAAPPPVMVTPPPVDDRMCPPGMRIEGDTCVRIPPPPPPPSDISTAAWITGGVGVGLMAIGSFAGVIALIQDGEAALATQQAGCNPERDFCGARADLTLAEDLASEAETWGWVSTVGFAAGGTAFFVALLMPYELRDQARASAWASPDGGGASLRLSLP